MDHRVTIISCQDYTQAAEQLALLIQRLGGIERYARPGETLLLKANLLAAAAPDQALSTHPAVVAAAAKLCAAQGAKAVIADSPGGPYLEAGMRRVYEKTGMAQAAAESGAELNYDLSARQVSLPEGKVLRSAQVITPAASCDGMWNLCKMKTHTFMTMTGAVKNHFGLIPGVTKVGFHASHQDKARFADMLLDLALWASPRLNIMDAVLAMEGDGPGASGTPRQVGLLLASEDPVALDAVELVGGTLEELRIPDFRLPGHVRTNIMERFGPFTQVVERASRSLMAQTPKIRPEACIGCGICKNACPAQAIAMRDKKAHVAPARCIHCYCCHELCPEQAVALKRGFLSRLLQ